MISNPESTSNYLKKLNLTSGSNTNQNSQINSAMAFPSSNPTLLTQKNDTVELGTKNATIKANKKQRLLKLAGIGVAAAGLITAGILIAKGKFSQVKKLAESIEFKPATSVKEAEDFASKTLGIKHVSYGDNLDVANWANKGLVDVNNATKGKAVMPKKVICCDSPDENEMACMTEKWELFINKKYFESIDEKIKSDIPALKDFLRKEPNEKLPTPVLFNEKSTEELNNLIELFESGGVKSFEDKTKLNKMIWQYFDHYKTLINNNERFADCLIKMLADRGLIKEGKIVLEKEGKAMFKNQEEVQNKIQKMLDNFYCNKNKSTNPQETVDLIKGLASTIQTHDRKSQVVLNFERVSPFDPIYHEMGHLQHMAQNQKMFEEFAKTYKNNAEYLGNKDQQFLAEIVSQYANTDPLEFVAECFKGQVKGKKLQDSVMSVYKEFGGPVFD